MLIAESIAEGILSTNPVSIKFKNIGTPRTNENIKKNKLSKEKKTKGLSSLIRTSITLRILSPS